MTLRWLEIEEIRLLNLFRPVFLACFGAFVVVAVIKCFFAIRNITWKVRDWSGAIGLVLAISSTALLAVHYGHILTAGSLIAHGSSLLLLYYSGFVTALLSIVLGATGYGWVRRSGVVIGLVMTFQWLAQMASTVHGGYVTNITMVSVLILLLIGYMLSRLIASNRGQ